MASISLTLPVSGTQITAGLHSTNYGAIQTVINGGLDNTNIASGAAIAPSKLAGYPASSSVFLRGDGTWTAASGAAVQTWTSLVDLVNTVTESDLFGTQGTGWTVPAATLGTTDALTVTAVGDFIVASATAPTSKFSVYLGGSKLIDTNVAALVGSSGGGSAIRVPFKATLTVAALGATNAQNLLLEVELADTAGGAGSVTTGIGAAWAAGTVQTTRKYSAASNGPSAIDMTAQQALRLTHTWGTASASNELRIRQAKAVKS